MYPRRIRMNGWRHRRKLFTQQYQGIVGVEHNYLSISGGGANGAYTAGIMVAWTELETRPQFTIVTGISTGALIAPFVFLGSDYDGLIKDLYTQSSTADIITERGLIEFLTGDSAVNPVPLRGKLVEVINEDILAALAVEARKGRKLLISTTNLDAMRRWSGIFPQSPSAENRMPSNSSGTFFSPRPPFRLPFHR